MLLYAIRYYYRIARGHLLRPWSSPALRWRYETLFGIRAEELTPAIFFRLSWDHRGRFLAFLHWAKEMEPGGSPTVPTEWKRWPV